MSFARDITEFVERTKLSNSQVTRVVALKVLENAQFLSPVDTGRFRGNWRVSVKVPDLTTVKTSSRFDAEGRLAKYKPGDTIWVTNNLHYAPFLERGSSQQAPVGILQPTIVKVKNDFAELVRQLREQS